MFEHTHRWLGIIHGSVLSPTSDVVQRTTYGGMDRNGLTI